MKYLRKLLVLGLLICLALLFACGEGRSGGETYDQQMTRVMQLYKQHQFGTSAIEMAKVAQAIMQKIPVDRYVAFLEVGKIALAAEKYDLAIKYLQLAEKRFLNIEGTISISEEASSLFLDDTEKEYEAEPYELIMISPYLALTYAAKQDYSGASIERNRAINKISEYIERNNKRYLENAFARLLSAVLYERDRKIQDAKLEYNNIMKYSVFKDIAKASLATLEQERKTTLALFVDIGLSPIKRQEIYDKEVPNPSGAGTLQVKYAYSVMTPRHGNRVAYAKVLVNGTEVGRTKMLYNVEQVVMKQFEKNKEKMMNAIYSRVISRVLAQGIGQTVAQSDNTFLRIGGALMSLGARAGMAIERADTRSWLTLPRFIHAFRLNGIKTGEHTVSLKYCDASGNVIGNSNPKKVKIDTDGNIVVSHFAIPY